MNTGIVLWFNLTRGIGMIVSGNRLVFVHYANIISDQKRKNLSSGDKVEFDLYESAHRPGGVEARNVTKIT